MKKRLIITGLVCFLVPVLAFYLLLRFGMEEITLMGVDQRLAKTENYARIARQSFEDATVFFGDSITELCPLNEVYAPYVKDSGVAVVNRGISGETTQTMLERIETNVLAMKPRNLVMLMGVNDLNEGIATEQIVENIATMIDLTKEQSPDTHIVLEAVYPINTSSRTKLYEKIQIGQRNNEMIDDLNERLEKMAADKQIVFLDVTAYLEDELGELKASYTFDGLHPNVDGYMAVRNQIIEVLK